MYIPTMKLIQKERIMKLVKIQRHILETAVASEKASNIRKPIFVHSTYHSGATGLELSGFNKSYTLYATKMEQLIDAGLIQRENDGFAYITTKGISLVTT